LVDLYADMFELAPVSLWLEDFSALKLLFERWRTQGVSHLRAHLRERPQRIAECSSCLKLLRVNQRTLSLYGARSQQQLMDNLRRVFRNDMLDAYVDELAQLWDGKLHLSTQTVNYTLAGDRLTLVLNASVLPGHEQRWDRVLVALEDVTDRTHAERALRDSEQYARGLFEHSPISLWVKDFSAIRGLLDEVRALGVVDLRRHLDDEPEFVVRCMRAMRVVDVNQRTLEMFGASDKPALLANLTRVFRDGTHAGFSELLVDLWEGKLCQQREALTHTLDGQAVHVYLQFSVLPGHEERWDRTLVSLTDITARKRAEANLAYLGSHDHLTGLRNRAFFTEELARLEREGLWPMTVLMVDLDGLKTANDEFGHDAGDELLRRAGQVLGAVVEPPMTAARIGGDEFVLLLPGADEHGGARMLLQLREVLALNNQIHDGAPLQLSIGEATGHTGECLQALIHRADARMYDAKREAYAARGVDRRGVRRLNEQPSAAQAPGSAQV